MNRSIMRWVALAAVVLAFSVSSFGQIAVGISVRFGPPPLPVYAQPICPGPGFMWTPGYWAWNDDDGYYWVPGTWVMAPIGMYWTPGYWGWGGGFYAWHPGYWGPHVGFYGGINYGFGYTGVGFMGGEWRGGGFYYNRYVTNVSVTNVTNVYNRTVIVNNRSTTSFNGGTGGIQARPTPQEEAWGRERHTAALPAQSEHEVAASRNRENFASQNHGRPAIAATARPGDFARNSIVGARAAGGEYRAPTISPHEARVNPAVNRGNPSVDNRGRSNEGFRPFTPPTKNNVATPRGNENYSRPAPNRPNPPADNRGKSNDGFRPFTPPAKNNPVTPRPNENYSRPANNNRSNGNQNNDRPMRQQREVTPRQESRPAPQHSTPPPQHNSPPPVRNQANPPSHDRHNK